MNILTTQAIGVLFLSSMLLGGTAIATETITFNYTQVEWHNSGKSSQMKQARQHKAAQKNGKNASIKSAPKKPKEIGLLIPAVQKVR